MRNFEGREFSKYESHCYSENRKRVAEIYHHRCGNFEVCGNRSISTHHIIRKCEGGGNEKGNLASLCRSCHDVLEEIIDSGGLRKYKEKKGLDVNEPLPSWVYRRESLYRKGERGRKLEKKRSKRRTREIYRKKGKKNYH